MKLVTLIKKEFARFFHDPRLIVALLVPGVLIFALYTFLGSVIKSEEKADFTVYVSGESVVMEQISGAVDRLENYTLTTVEATDAEAAKKAVKDGDATAYIAFSEDFDRAVEDYDMEGDAPQVSLYYRSDETASSVFYSIAMSVLDGYEQSLANKFDVNAGMEKYNLTDEDDIMTSVLSQILPFIIIVFIYSAAMSVTLESVAGEKERGTLATILATSVKRSHVALGKIIPLTCITCIGAVSSFLGVILSLPRLMGMSVGAALGSFGFVSYLMLFLLIISAVPLIVSLLTALSTYARSLKEASAYTSILMILVMVLSIISMVVPEIGGWYVAIPIFNVVGSMQGIISATYAVWQPLVSIFVNLAVTVLLTMLIAKMLSSERIMFGK